MEAKLISRIWLSTLVLFCWTNLAHSQDLLPTRIVGIEYPVVAIAARIQGVVRVKCGLDSEGRVISTQIVEVTGTPAARNYLGKAVEENARLWMFSSRNITAKRPTSTVITYKFEFEVKENPAYLRSRFIYDFPETVRVVAELPTIQVTR